LRPPTTGAGKQEMMPRLRRGVIFYSPDNPAAQISMRIARDAIASRGPGATRAVEESAHV
jgi:hypothetical protein